MLKTNRRDFIKISSLATGGLMAASAINWAEAAPYYAQKGVKKIPTYCEVCFWKCAGWVWYDKDGKPYKLTGNENDPLCNGKLCPRGSAGLGMYNDPDRLKTPLIRVEKDGQQTFKTSNMGLKRLTT